MGHVQILPGDFTITSESWPAVKLWRSGKVFTSDSFTQAGKLLGSLTDTYRGGHPIRWEGYDSWDRSEGKALVRSSGVIGLPIPGADYRADIHIDQLPAAGEVRFGARRDILGTGVDATELTIRVFSTGTVTLMNTAPGVSQMIGTSSRALSNGDRLALVLDGSTAQAIVNGVVVITAEIGTLDSGYFTFNATDPNKTSSIHEVVITPV